MMKFPLFILKIKKNRTQIIRTLGFTILLRSVYGFSILGIAYFFNIELKDVREFEFLGLRVYFLVLTIFAILVVRRFYKLYKWWTTELRASPNE